VISTLLPRWESLSLPEAARETIGRLGDPSTHIVIAGQQPAQWGGPVMLAVKALAICRLASSLNELGIPTAPLFWIASEDHDATEFWAGRAVSSSRPTVEFARPFKSSRRMLGSLTYPTTAATRLSSIAPLFDSADAGEWAERLAATLCESPVDEFQNLWVDLFGSKGLLPIRPEWLRDRQRPIVAGELDRPGEFANGVEQGIVRIERLGLPVPIPKPAQFPFFWVGDDGGRHRLVSDGEFIRIGSKNSEPRTKESLQIELESDAHRVSPDALLRPIVQDILLEPSVSLLGPSEFAYQLELSEIYRHRGIARPVLLPRPRVRWLSAADDRVLGSLGIDPAQIQPEDGPFSLIPSIQAVQRQLELSKFSEPMISLMEAWSEDRELAHALRRRVDRLARRLKEDMRKLEAALQRGAGGDVEEDRRQLEEILERTFPGGEEGERVSSLLGFLLRFGEDGLDALVPSIAWGDGQIRMVTLPTEEVR